MQPEKIKTNIKQAVPFFRVSNIKNSLSYYIDGLGFEITHKWINEGKLEWCSIKNGDASLMLQEFSNYGHHTFNFKGKLGEGVSICFICENALAIYKEITSNGIKTSEPFVGNGMWVISLSDPDGYLIEFESPTNIPEGTTLSELAK